MGLQCNNDGIVIQGKEATLKEIKKGVQCEIIDGSMVKRLNINNGVIDREFLEKFEPLGNRGKENEESTKDFKETSESKGFKEDYEKGKDKQEEEQVVENEKMTLDDLLE